MNFNDRMLLEGKIEDFIKSNNLSKEDALNDENIKKLKKILKLNDDKTRAKVEKYFQKNPETQNSNEDTSTDANDASAVEVPDIVKSEVEKLPKEKKGLWKTIWRIISKACKNYTAEKTGKLLDELFMGNFKDAVIDIYKKDMHDNLNSEEKLKKSFENLKNFDGYKFAERQDKRDSRKDDETSTNIDVNNSKIWAMWYSSKKDQNLAKILSDIVKQIQEAGQKLEEDTKKIKEELSKSGIEMSDEEIAKFGPAIVEMLNKKLKGDELKKQIEKLKSEIKESIDKKILFESRRQRQLNESKIIITESMKNQFLFEAICENKTMQEGIAAHLISEGWFGNIMSRVGKGLANVGKKSIQALTQYSIGPILGLGGIALGALTGGWGAELIIKTMDFIERQGKSLRNTFERVMTKYANSKGVITYMNYSLEGDKDKKYSMRFYEKDMVWRVLNLSDQLKHPSKEYVKSIVNSDAGKKYREKLRSIWDPLFSKTKGGKIDFVKLFEQAKSVKIPEKALKLFQEFAENYDTILANCIESPKIDTRTQSSKD